MAARWLIEIAFVLNLYLPNDTSIRPIGVFLCVGRCMCRRAAMEGGDGSANCGKMLRPDMVCKPVQACPRALGQGSSPRLGETIPRNLFALEVLAYIGGAVYRFFVFHGTLCCNGFGIARPWVASLLKHRERLVLTGNFSDFVVKPGAWMHVRRNDTT